MTTNDALFTAKQQLRQQMHERLRAASAEQIEMGSAQILQHLMTQDTWLRPNAHVAFFGGLVGEPELRPLIPWLIARGCTPVFFGCADDQLLPKAVQSGDELQRGVFGVWVPHDDLPMVEPSALDVILTPGLAFDVVGHRLGRGRGYYDRFFADPRVRALRVALGFDFQLIDAVPVEIHDATMHAIITETGAKMQN